MDLGNVNIVEEQQKKYAKHPMFKQHQKLFSEQEDLHMALKSCNEIGSAKTLLAFMLDLQKIEGSRIPTKNDVNMCRNNAQF